MLNLKTAKALGLQIPDKLLRRQLAGGLGVEAQISNHSSLL
jgi:hypothetical protein